MKTWSFVDGSGVFTGRTFSGPESDLAANTPDGCKAVAGMLQPAPIPKRRADNVEVTRERQVRQRITELELAQHRPIRELAIDPANAKAKQRLMQIEDEIAALRSALT